MSGNYEDASPNAGALIQSLRAFGYDICTAIADLIDNSITAFASNISVRFEWNNGDPWIAIIDDGHGMNESELFEAMRPGSKNPLEIRPDNDLGRFGLGLKTASFSQCRKLTVISKKKTDRVCARCWDLDVVTQTNEWRLLKEVSEIGEQLSSEYFNPISKGTIVLWEKIDRIIPDEKIDDEDYQKAFLDYARQVKEHIAIVYSSYMRGANKINFSINGSPIELWDPFMENNKFTTRQPVETLYVNGHEVVVQPFILPHMNKMTPEEYEKYAGRRGWADQQGFYVYRNNRLIIDGDWLINGMQKKEQYKLARIRIDIGNDLDGEWNIDVKKSAAAPPVSIRADIRRIAKAAQSASSRIYRNRGKIITRTHNGDKSFVWHQYTRNGKIGYKINTDHVLIREALNNDHDGVFKRALDLIEETIPVPSIISDYSENSEKMLKPYEGRKDSDINNALSSMFDLFIQLGYKPEEAISEIANTEPFMYEPENIAIFCEKKGIKYDGTK